MITQGRLAELQAKEANIRSTLIGIQLMLFPHVEVLKHELPKAKTLMQWDAHISTKECLVDMVAHLEI